MFAIKTSEVALSACIAEIIVMLECIVEDREFPEEIAKDCKAKFEKVTQTGKWYQEMKEYLGEKAEAVVTVFEVIFDFDDEFSTIYQVFKETFDK